MNCIHGTCDLSRYGTRERHFDPSDRLVVRLSAIRTETCASLLIEVLLQVVSTQEAYRLLWGCTEAYDQYVGLARKRRRAPLKSPEVSRLKAFKSSQTV